MGTLEAIFQKAIKAMNSGKPLEAERLFKDVLKELPNNIAALNLVTIVLVSMERHAEAEAFISKAIKLNQSSDVSYYNYGLISKRLGKSEQALEQFNKAIHLNAQAPETWNNRGTVFNDLKQYENAIADFNQAISLAPNYSEAFCNKGKSLGFLKRYDEAFEAYDKALAIKPDLAEAWLGRGFVFTELKRYDEAFVAYDKALALKPDLAEAWLGRGNVFYELKRHDEAFAAYDKALAIKPDLQNAWLGRGNAFYELKRHDEALAAYGKALAIKPDLDNAWLGRGNVFTQLKRYDEAFAAYDKALALKPDLAEAWLGRGNAFYELKRYDEALAAYEKALAIKLDFAVAWLGRANIFIALRRHDDAFAAYDKALAFEPDLAGVEGARLHSKMHLCNWESFESDCDHLIGLVRNNKQYTNPFAFLGINSSAEDQYNCARLWVCKQHPPGNQPLWKGEIYRHDNIRIGYVSADFHEHATAHLMAGVIEHHDKSKFDVTAISIGPNDNSPMRRRLEGSFEKFVDARMLNDAEVAKQIRAAEIDILVDLKGFTQDARTSIFARRSAPIQVNYLGYPGTAGASYIDYIVVDSVIIPLSQQSSYAEKLVYLPDSYQANDSKRPVSERIFTREECGLPDGNFVFCCFNDSYKIVPAVFDCWMRILAKVPGSVLWLLENNATAAMNLKREAELRGVSAERLVFAKRMSLHDHLARHRLANLFLDTLPYNAHTTASDALWAGLPLLTRLGETFAGRVAASLLNAIGLPELITKTPEEYERMAIDLAMHPEKLAAIKRKLASNRLTTPLFDTKLFTRHIEAAYNAMYERYQIGLAPDHIVVPN